MNPQYVKQGSAFSRSICQNQAPAGFVDGSSYYVCQSVLLRTFYMFSFVVFFGTLRVYPALGNDVGHHGGRRYYSACHGTDCALIQPEHHGQTRDDACQRRPKLAGAQLSFPVNLIHNVPFPML